MDTTNYNFIFDAISTIPSMQYWTNIIASWMWR